MNKDLRSLRRTDQRNMKKFMRKMIAAAAAMMLSFTVISAKGTTVHAEDAMGTGGRIYFNNGYSVALNWADPFDAYAVQSITDAQDSAVEESYGGSTLIADHNTQGFDIIKQYGVGSTMKIVDEQGNTTTYVCISYYPSVSWYNGIVMLPDGRDAWYGDSALWLKTCNSDGTNTVSYWTPLWY